MLVARLLFAAELLGKKELEQLVRVVERKVRTRVAGGHTPERQAPARHHPLKRVSA